ADETRLNAVDRGIELIGRHTGELLRKGRLKGRKVALPECAAATYEILPETGLRLMERVAAAPGEGCAIEAGRGVLLVERVARLVKNREECLRQEVARVASGDTDVVPPEVGGEGVRRHVEAPPAQVVAKLRRDLQPELLLALF